MSLRDSVQQNIVHVLVKRMRIIGVILALVVFAIGYVIVIGPKYNEIRDAGVLNRQDKQQRLADRKAYLGDLQDMIDVYTAIDSGTVEDLAKVLPREADIPGMFVMLQDLAVDAGYRPTQITMSSDRVSSLDSTTKGSTVSALGVMNVTMGLEGSVGYTNTKNLLRVFERNMRLLDVRSFTFNPSSTGIDTEDQVISVNFRTYFLSDNSTE